MLHWSAGRCELPGTITMLGHAWPQVTSALIGSYDSWGGASARKYPQVSKKRDCGQHANRIVLVRYGFRNFKI